MSTNEWKLWKYAAWIYWPAAAMSNSLPRRRISVPRSEVVFQRPNSAGGETLCVRCPEVGHRNAVQIAGEWDNIGAGVEDHAANPTPACRSSQSLQSPKVAAI